MTKQKLPPVLNRDYFDSDEDYELYLSSEKGEWKTTGDITTKRHTWKNSAEQTINGKRSRISIAIPERNLTRIKALALRRGVPYQTLINEVLHDHIKHSSQQ